ncbi:anthranilate synthase component I [Alkalihalobacillus sp. LMS39]|uniref:anthranilate synthase component I n=1 Tax=Alkalihalobacillus sp. LMS39 TaxID=2924032 RepID=UPI001FB51865|nr:anthranilate synthase component I [Alkalihalobacillus sp. LMS39]UOE92337.1 anthranilate synthase component I [Alkalihalobacillus sp. LMS39]
MITTTKPSFLHDSATYKTVPIVGHFFADTVTPIQLFQQLEKDAVFLLESKDEQSPWSRFSFIGLTPIFFITEQQGKYTVANQEQRIISELDSLKQAFDAAIDVIQVAPIDVPIPFKGGAVGYISYDAVEVFEPILNQGEAVEEEKLHFVFCETIIAYDHVNKELYIVHHAKTNGQQEEASRIYEEEIKKMNALVENMTKVTADHQLLTPPNMKEEVQFDQVTSNYEKHAFLQDVEKIKEYIRAGDIFQAVLSQRFERDITVTGLELYRVLRMINPSPYLFYVKVNGYEIVGSSPERLVQVQDSHVEIHPIAGTRPRGKTETEDEQLAEDLLADEKERAEHYMLVDLARNDIGRVAKYGTVETPTLLEIGKFSHVMHIISKVTGKLSDVVHPIEALQSSFPAGTVSGAPKIRAMEILHEIEPTKRGIYAGAIGYLGYDGNIDSCIAIRTMVIKDKKVYVQAGAGIVADSVPEKEWEETRNKAKALIKAIQVAEEMFSKKVEVRHV